MKHLDSIPHNPYKYYINSTRGSVLFSSLPSYTSCTLLENLPTLSKSQTGWSLCSDDSLLLIKVGIFYILVIHTTVDPVNEMISISMCSLIAAPAVGP